MTSYKMMKLPEPDYLETLHCILGQISENISNDYSKIIQRIIKPTVVDHTNKIPYFSGDVNLKKSFSAIKMMLKLCEKLNSNNTECEVTRISVNHVLEAVKYILDNYSHELNNNLQEDIISIIYLLFKITFMQRAPDNICLLAEFHQNNLDWIKINTKNESISVDNFIFRLKIFYVVYSVMMGTSVCFENISLFYKKLNNSNTVQGIDECKVLSDLVLCGADDIAIQTLLFALPQYVSFHKSGEVVEIIWKEISYLICCQEKSVNYSRILLIMCYFFKMCFDESIIKDKEELMDLFFNDVNYWNLIQFCLVEKDPMMRKQAMYLFKKTIDLLKIKGINVESCDKKVSGDKMAFWWNVDFKNELSNIYSEIIVVLEFLDEQQTHIIKPIFQMVDKLVQKFLDLHDKGKKIDFAWIMLIHQKAMMHESTQIVKWGLSHLMQLPERFFSDECIASKTVNILSSILNNMSLYYNDGLAISNELTAFFIKMTKLKSSKMFFSLFIKQICSLVWSPEALFFVIHSLSPLEKHPFWGEEEISEIQNFVSKAFKTHNRIIRSGVQCELLNSITRLTDEKNVSLENVILLLSTFSTEESLKRGSQTWDIVLKWLKSGYSENEAEKILEKYGSRQLEKKFNDRSIAFMFILFYHAYETEESNFPLTRKLSEMLCSFKDVDKRLYCDTSSYDHRLSIICHICEENLNHSMPDPLVKLMLLFFTDIVHYAVKQLKQMSNLQDFNTCQMYIKTLETVIKIHVLYEVNSVTLMRTLVEDIVKDWAVHRELKCQLPAIQNYWRMKFLRAVYKTYLTRIEVPSSALALLKGANEPLQKDECHSGNTRDVQTVWGRMNSEFLEANWEISQLFISNGIIVFGSEKSGNEDNWVSVEELVGLCVEALNIGGYGVLSPIMTILGKVLPREKVAEVRGIVSSIWKLIMERRKTDEFKSLIKQFVEMLFQNKLIFEEEWTEILMEYTDSIFSDSSLVVVNIFVKHIQKMEITTGSIPLYSHIIGKGLIFGQVQKKDERLTAQVCSHIEFLRICPVGAFNTSNEIRAMALQKILTLDRNLSVHRSFGRNLIETLLKMENDINKNRTRYFGDSHVHRVKHRLMQALLLLEPLLYPDLDLAEELAKWLYTSLMTENPQPSVKYQQEWLLIRLLIRYSALLNNFWSYFSDSVEKKTKGICTLIAVSYHLCKLVPSHLTAVWVDKAIPIFLPFSMDQHFEVRLYALVVLQKLYELAETRKLDDVLKKYEIINQCVLQSIERGCKGNSGKNCIKLQEDFYLNVFHPLDHYSMQTIFMDLPRLANVGSDEWISVQVFKSCGVDPTKINISFKSADPCLEELESAKWLVEKSHPGMISELMEQNPDDFLGNYQKKIIPVKELVPGLDTQNNNDFKRDGLIVVASLIDRIPNLGGLARTCEIFGASEYIINSLKYIEDKQFTSLSVTAEKWIPIKEVKSQNLLDYILEMKSAGYTVIGAEQALYSQSLNSVKFPKKSLLLLGNEREGIPPNLLPLLDICVEIPQVGIIRSLNVHVTGALFIWEYAKQNCFH